MNAWAKRVLLWSVLGFVLVALLVYAFRPRPQLVDLHTVVPGPFQVNVEADGVTRVKDVFTISAPVGGRLLRTSLKAGDPVTLDTTVVATIEPSDPEFLDPRTLAEGREDLEAAQAGLDLAAAELERAEAEQAFARTELERARKLFAGGSVPRRFVDEAERAARTADALVAAATAALDAREHEVLRIRARLFTPVARDEAVPCECVTLRSPIEGRVLRVFEESETVVAPGTPLLELGDPAQLEVVADFLSEDAVRIAPGRRAFVEGWGGDEALAARVRHVEPLGFTKVSALGIEEQRVNVVLDLVSPADRWEALGHGYRVTVRVVLWEADDVLAVPVTALFRADAQWRLFVSDGGRAARRDVAVGRRSGLWAQIVEGVAVGDRVIVNPPATLEPGAAVAGRRRD